MKNKFGQFFSYYRIWQTSGNKLSGFTKYFGCPWTIYKIISVTPNRLLKTQILEKKSIFPAKKFFRRILSCIIE